MKEIECLLGVFIVLSFLCPSIEKAEAAQQILYTSSNGSGSTCSSTNPCSLATALSTVTGGDGDIIYLYGPNEGYGNGTYSSLSLSGANHANVTVSATPAVIAGLTFNGRGVVTSGNGDNRPLFTDGASLSGAGSTAQYLRFRTQSAPYCGGDTDYAISMYGGTASKDTTLQYSEVFNGGGGVWIRSNQYITIQHNYFHNQGLTSCSVDHHVTYLVSQGTEANSWTEGVKIYHNTSSVSGGDFFQVAAYDYYGGDNQRDSYVDIWDNDSSGNKEQFFDSKGVSNVKIRGNIISDNDFGGVWGNNEGYGTDNFWVYDNVFHTHSSYALGCGGGAGCSSWWIWNNIFYNNATSPPYNDFCAIVDAESNWVIANNVFWNNTEGGICGSLSSADPQIRNNIFYNNGTNGGVEADVAGNVSYNWFNTGDVGGKGSNSLTGTNPNFVNSSTLPYDFRLQSSSAAINSGIALTGDALYTIGIDKAGTSRPQGGAWDLGAFEYGASTPDTQPPIWPTGTTFSASATSSSSITVTWSAATDDVGVTGYTVQRCTGLPAACPDTSFATVGTPAASPFVNNTGLSPNTDYSYRVRASDAAGNLSGWTNTVSAKTQPLAAPVITSSLTASATTGSAFSYQITASNTPTSYSATGLPAWASINTNTGLISGTPSTTGTTDITIRATNAAGTGTATLVLTVTTPPPVSQNLLLGLNFNESTGTTSSDISGHNHTGTLSNATWSSGKTGGGISFSGNANSYVSIPNESDFDLTNNFTVSLWMKTASFGSAWAALVSKGDSSWSLTRYDTTNTLDFNSFSPSANDLQGTANVANDAWHHLAIVYDGTTKKLYVDGNIDAQTNFTQTLLTNNFPVRIGGNAEYTSGAFNGSVDDVRIYNKALTQTEIQTDMNTPLTQGGTGTFTPCNTVTTSNFSQAAYNSYGAPYDAFQTSTNLINANCSSSDSHTIQATLGQTGDTTRIVYTKGYYYANSNWTQYTGTCTGALNGDWCQGSVSATITNPNFSTASASAPAYFVGMTCSVQGGGWKCGCRDTSCNNFYWQIQGAGQ